MKKISSKRPKKLSAQLSKQRPKTFKNFGQHKVRLFIDPASISSGWALFDGKVLIAHGTVGVEQKLPPFDRLKEVYKRYLLLATSFLSLKIEEVHIEQLPRSCHVYTHYSVCAIGIAFTGSQCKVVGDVPIQSWQKFCDWKGERAPLEAYKGNVDSEDQLAAIGMGLWFVNKEN